MKCERCNCQITEKQGYSYSGKVYCENCLMDIGLKTKQCDPWASYIDARTREQSGMTN